MVPCFRIGFVLFDFTVTVGDIVFDNFEQVGDVFVFRGQSQPNYIVAIFHQLETLPPNVGMRNSRLNSKAGPLFENVMLQQAADQNPCIETELIENSSGYLLPFLLKQLQIQQ